MRDRSPCSCHDCGTSQWLPDLASGQVATCIRCAATLRQTWSASLELGSALALSSIVLLLAASTEVLATVETAGQVRTATLFSGPMALLQNGLWELAALVLATSVVVPLAVVLAQVFVLVGVRSRRPPPGLRSVFIWRNRLRPWAMIEIYLVGYFVAYAKLGALVQISPGPGFFALFCFMISMIATDAFLDADAVWEAIDRNAPRKIDGAAARATRVEPGLLCCPSCHLACRPGPRVMRCPRCGTRMHRRRIDSVAIPAALAVSALVLYVPANAYPALTVVRLGQDTASTILNGVLELAAAQQLPLALLVFVASVAIPVLKLLALAAMIAVTVTRRGGHARPLTVLYRFILAIGRWSMIDIFMESILSGLVKFGEIARIDAGTGAVAFAAVVVLTILASERFDPRLLWDIAGR